MSEWVHKLKTAWKSLVDAATVTVEKAKDASDEILLMPNKFWILIHILEILRCLLVAH